MLFGHFERLHKCSYEDDTNALTVSRFGFQIELEEFTADSQQHRRALLCPRERRKQASQLPGQSSPLRELRMLRKGYTTLPKRHDR